MRNDLAQLTQAVVDNLNAFLAEVRPKLLADQLSIGEGSFEQLKAYNQHCQIFNQRLQFKPFVIVYCEFASDVQLVYNAAIDHKLAVRIRGGGHDHEGECTGTNVILIDVSRLTKITVDKDGLAHIGAGNRFIRLTTELAKQEVMIPHGTCATVCISGFSFGGGWGPWTRKYGMACERLVGADMVLGDGTLISASEDGNEQQRDLLWALRGGGGMSYGLVTELRYKTFKLPKELIKFELRWNLYNEDKPDEFEEKHSTVSIMDAWQTAIDDASLVELIGTNLKVNARTEPEEAWDYENIAHNCTMYGYWEGDLDGLVIFVLKYFCEVMPDDFCLEGMGGTDAENLGKVCASDLEEAADKLRQNWRANRAVERVPNNRKNYGEHLMASWDRESYQKVLLGMNRGATPGGDPIPPDLDMPAPHKITSRLVNRSWLDQKEGEGYKAFLQTMTSNLLAEDNRENGLFSYVTLGAITGPYYHKHDGANASFPWADKLYTIQYQTWWNDKQIMKLEQQDNPVYLETNRALDWMQQARDAEIPHTEGAFISFKDASIPTETYFGKNYERLKEIGRMEGSSEGYNCRRGSACG